MDAQHYRVVAQPPVANSGQSEYYSSSRPSSSQQPASSYAGYQSSEYEQGPRAPTLAAYENGYGLEQQDLRKSQGYDMPPAAEHNLYTTPSQRMEQQAGGSDSLPYRNYTQLQSQSQGQQGSQGKPTNLQPVIPGQQNVNININANRQAQAQVQGQSQLKQQIQQAQMQQEQLQAMYLQQQASRQVAQPQNAGRGIETSSADYAPQGGAGGGYGKQQEYATSSKVVGLHEGSGVNEDEIRRLKAALSQVDSQLKDSLAREKALHGKLSQLSVVEMRNAQLREEQQQLLREMNGSKQQQQQGNAVLKALEDKCRSITAERDSLNSQFDELMMRHNLLERKMLDMSHRQATEMEGAKTVNAMLAETQGRAATMAAQNAALQEEVEQLKATMRDESATGQKALKDLQVEFLTMKKQYIQLQAHHEDETSSLASRLTVERDDAIKRLYDIEQKNVILSSQLTEMEDRKMWLSDQVRALEGTIKAMQEQQAVELSRHTARAAKDVDVAEGICERAAAVSISRAKQTRSWRAWVEETRYSSVRQKTLESLLATVKSRWAKAAHRTAFEQWRQLWEERKRNADEGARAVKFEGLGFIINEWSCYARAETTRKATDKVLAVMSNKAEQARKEELGKQAAVHESAIVMQREQLERDLKRTRDSLLDQLQEGRELHKKELERLSERSAADIQALRQAHGDELAVLSAEGEATKKRLTQGWEDAVARLEADKASIKADLEGQMAKLKSSSELQLQTLRAKAEAEAKEAADRLAQQAKEASDRLSSEVKRASEELAATNKAHEQEISSTKEAHKQEMAKSTASFESRIKEMEINHKSKVDAMTGTYDATIAAMQASHSQAVKGAAEELRVVKEKSEAAAKASKEAHEAAMSSAASQAEAREKALMLKMSELEAETADRISKTEKDRDAKVAAIQSEMELAIENLNASHDKTVNIMASQAKGREDGLKAQLASERESWLKDKEAMVWSHDDQMGKAQKMHEDEVQKLKDDAAEMESQLRAKMVAEKARSDQDGEEERSAWARKEEDLRKRILDKEKEIAAILQEAEAERLRVVEQAEEDRQSVQREADRKIEQVRIDAVKVQEEVRAKMHAREKELMSKIEGIRAENIRAQEQFERDLKEKETSFQRRLDQEKSLQAQVDNLMSSTSIKEMQAKIAGVTEQLMSSQAECGKAAEREATLKQELEMERGETARLVQAMQEVELGAQGLQQRMVEKQGELDALAEQHRQLGKKMEDAERQVQQGKEVQANLIRQAEGTNQDLDAAKVKQGELQEIASAAQRDMGKLQSECKRLEKELLEASHALLKRGDEFSETMSLLQGRFDAESKDLHEKLRVANATNARLAAELEESSTLLLTFKDQTSGAQQAVEELYRKKIDAAEQELKQANDTYQERLTKAQYVAQAQLEERLAAAQAELAQTKQRVEEDAMQRVRASAERCAWLEQELEKQASLGADASADAVREIERRAERLARENDTLTEELDNCLAENAQLRADLDSRLDNSRIGDSPGGISSVDDDMSSAASSYGAGRITALTGSLSSAGSRQPSTTCGVHTTRLLRSSYKAWMEVTVEQRMTGKSPMFSGLEYFISQDGSLSDWFPVGRVRRSELDVKADKLGSGSFAEVFRGELKLPVAVKKMRGSVQQKELLEFVREGEMLRSINHPCIVKLLGVYQEGGTYSLIQECVAGVNMFDHLHKYNKTLNLDRQMGVALQMCDALAYLHSMRIIHRDVKPQNVIYNDKTGTSKLCDFGLARLIPVGVETVSAMSLGTGGTPAYQAPEVLSKRDAGRKLDLYGFAVTLWEMYTTQLPWSDCDLERMTKKVVLQNERPPMPKDMPRDYAEMIARSWQTDTSKRPEFKDILPTLRALYDAFNPSHSRMHLSNASTVVAGSSRTALQQQQQQARPSAPPKLSNSQYGAGGQQRPYQGHAHSSSSASVNTHYF